MKNSRTKSTLRNSIIGFLAYGVKTLLSFIARTYFIKILGVEYLGVNGLFSNILSILSLTDLGIYTVMVYSLYKPIAEDNKEKIAFLIRYFQKLYNMIALGVLVIGILLIPILPHIINGSQLSMSEINIYYLLLLMDSVATYFVISKSTILRADQKVYVIRIVNTLTLLFMYVFQIVLLVIYKKYILYLICQVCFTIINNIIISLIAKKMYPYLNNYNDIGDSKELTKNIVTNLKSSFLYKLGSNIMLSTDNILISLIIGTSMVGYYSNYVVIYSIINTIIMILIESVLASIGNYLVTESDEKKFTLFKILCYTFYFIGSFCVACYLAGMNDFINLWIGKEFVLNSPFIYCLASYRLIFCLIHPLWIIRESSGVFTSTKYVMIIAATVNIILSIILGKLIGLSGIVLATTISYFLTVYLYEPYQIMKKVFNRRLKEYWYLIIKLLLISIPTIIVGCILNKYDTNNIIFILFKFILCFTVCVISYYVLIKNTPEYELIINKIRSFTRRKKVNYNE